MSRLIVLDSCADCPHHKVLPDPDPHDSFCFDDVKVVCNKSNGKAVTVACRPYNVRKEVTPIPDWCPLPKSEK